MTKKYSNYPNYYFRRLNRRNIKSSINVTHSKPSEEKSDTKKYQWQKAHIILQAVLITVTAALVGVGFWQATISNKATSISQQSLANQVESMEKANRAYFSVTKVEPVNIDDFSKIPIKITFLNSGKTPAYKVESRSEIYIGKKSCMGFVLSQPEQFVSEMVVGSNGSFSVSGKLNIQQSQIKLIKNKKLFINIIGSTEYRDVFKRKHWLQYQLFYNVDKKAYTYCGEYNDAS